MTKKEKQILKAILLFPFKVIDKYLDWMTVACVALSKAGAERDHIQWKYGTGRYSKG